MENLHIKNKSGIDLKYHCELMENYFAESEVSVGKGIKAVHTADGTVLLFYVSNMDEMLVLAAVEGSGSGWESIKLSGIDEVVTAFDVHYLPDGVTFDLSYAVSKNQQSELRESYGIQAAAFQKNYKNISWNNKTIADKKRLIDHISMGNEWVMFSTRYEGTDAQYHYYNIGEAPQSLALPENNNNVIQITSGVWRGCKGVFVLYHTGDYNTMHFQALEEEGMDEAQRFDAGYTINGFTTVYGENGNSVLYVVGKGVVQFAGKGNASTIVPAGDILFDKVDVSVHNGAITVWTSGTEQGVKGLYYLTNQYFAVENGQQVLVPGRWTTPLKMYAHIDTFDSIRGAHFSNELFLFGIPSGGNAPAFIHFWQDRVSTQWQENVITVDNLSSFKKVETYTIDIELCTLDLSLNDKLDERLLITSDTNCRVYVDNRKYSLICGEPVAFALSMNKINIVMPVTGLSGASLTINADCLDQALVINPNSMILNQISSKLGKVDQLKNAKKANGEHLLSEPVSDAVLEKVVAGVHQVSNSAAAMETKMKQPKLRSSGASGGSTFSLNFDDLRYSGGMEMAISAPEMSIDSLLSDIGNGIGDIWHSVKQGFTIISNVVVESVKNGVKFLITIGEKCFEWVAEKVCQAVAFLERVWESIKVFFKDLFDFLAFLFNWDDIIEAKNHIKTILNNTINAASDKVVKEVEGKREWVVGYLTQLIEQVKNAQAPTLDNITKYSAEMAASGDSNSLASDSKVNWINSKKDVIFQTNSAKNVPEGKQPLVPSAGDTVDEIIGLFNAVISGEITLSHFFEQLKIKLFDLAADLILKLVNALFDLIISVIRGIQKVLQMEWDVPLLSSIYRYISGGAELSIVDFVSLLLAIPSSVIAKLVTGQKLFTEYTPEQLSTLSLL